MWSEQFLWRVRLWEEYMLLYVGYPRAWMLCNGQFHVTHRLRCDILRNATANIQTCGIWWQDWSWSGEMAWRAFFLSPKSHAHISRHDIKRGKCMWGPPRYPYWANLTTGNISPIIFMYKDSLFVGWEPSSSHEQTTWHLAIDPVPSSPSYQRMYCADVFPREIIGSGHTSSTQDLDPDHFQKPVPPGGWCRYFTLAIQTPNLHGSWRANTDSCKPCISEFISWGFAQLINQNGATEVVYNIYPKKLRATKIRGTSGSGNANLTRLRMQKPKGSMKPTA